MALYDERYAVFKRLPDGAAVWVSPEKDLAEAKKKITELAEQDSVEYFVHDFVLGKIVALAPGVNPADA